MIDPRLKAFVDRIESVEQEQRDLGADKRDIYGEVKEAGYIPKALRKIVSERRQKDRESIQEAMDGYRVALGMAGAAVRDGMVLDEAQRLYGFSRSAIHRESQSRQSSPVGRPMVDGDIGEWPPPHDPETGELPRDMCEADLGDYALIKPRVRVERPKKPEEDFSEKVRRMIAAAGLKPRTEPAAKFVSDEDANRALEEAIALRRPRERVMESALPRSIHASEA